MKKVIRNNIIGFIIGIVVFGSISVYATTQLSSNDVEYKDCKSTTQALNELYQRQAALPKAYSVGQTITVANEQYYVIDDSPRGQDYVTALKANPLTATEINNYGAGHVNMYNTNTGDSTYHTASDWNDTNHTGGMAYYSSINCGYGTDSNHTESGCTTSYNSSEVKHVVDAWAQAKFTNGELKTVDGYGARLITKDELIDNLGYGYSDTATTNIFINENVPDWVSSSTSDLGYWTMTQFLDSASQMWSVMDINITYMVSYDSSGAVRPVINIYKSKIQ